MPRTRVAQRASCWGCIAHHDVDEVRVDVIEKALVVRDEEDGLVRLAQPVDSCRHIPKRIHIQTRVNLVQDRHISIQDLLAMQQRSSP